MIRIDAAQTIADLRTLERELEIVAQQSLGQAAAFALAHAKATTSYRDRTGKLRASKRRRDNGPLDIKVSANTRYARFVEDGTSRIRPRKFMQAARDAAEVHLTRFIENGVNRAIG